MLQTTAQVPFSAKSCAPPPKKSSTREREYLRSSEVKAMIRAAKKAGRHRVRDEAVILLMFRHGLRTAELVALKWTQIDLGGGYIEVHRVKQGHDSIHPLRSPELRALRQIQREYADTNYSGFQTHWGHRILIMVIIYALKSLSVPYLNENRCMFSSPNEKPHSLPAQSATS